jgi:hypothetical protein
MSRRTPSSEDAMSATPVPPAAEQPHPAPAGLVDPTEFEAPMPTERTVRLRTNLPLQAFRFAAVGIRMTRMILRSHG